jgi:hypothetical protein
MQFTLPTVDVLGTIPRSSVADFDRVVGAPSYNGPPGPFPSVSNGRSVWFGGTLTNGNYFGTCEVTVSGAYQTDEVFEVLPIFVPRSSAPFANAFGELAELFRKKKFDHRWVNGDFVATATLEVRPPKPAVFKPDAITIPKGSPGPKADLRVQVSPPGPYEIVLSVKDPEQRASLFVPTIVRTATDGTETFYIQDLANAARQKMIVTATISSQMPCSAQAVVSTFTVDVA